MCLRCPRDTSQRPGGTHAQADALRNLVRIKVADDNDLRTARTGLEECAECFVGIAAGANARGIAEGEMMLKGKHPRQEDDDGASAEGGGGATAAEGCVIS